MKKEFPFAKIFLALILTITPAVGLFMKCFSIGGGEYLSVPNTLTYLFKSFKFFDSGKGFLVVLILVLLITVLIMAVALYEGVRAFFYIVSGNRVYLAGKSAVSCFNDDMIAAGITIALTWILDLIAQKAIGFSIISPSHELIVYFLWSLMSLKLYAPMLAKMWEKGDEFGHNFTGRTGVTLILASIAALFINAKWVGVEFGGLGVADANIFSVYSLLSLITEFASVSDGLPVYILKFVFILIIVALFIAVLFLSRFFATACTEKDSANDLKKYAGNFCMLNLISAAVFAIVFIILNHGAKDAFDSKLFSFSWKYWVFVGLNIITWIISGEIGNRYFKEESFLDKLEAEKAENTENEENVENTENTEASLTEENKESTSETEKQENTPLSEKAISTIDTIITLIILAIAFSTAFWIEGFERMLEGDGNSKSYDDYDYAYDYDYGYGYDDDYSYGYNYDYGYDYDYDYDYDYGHDDFYDNPDFYVGQDYYDKMEDLINNGPWSDYEDEIDFYKEDDSEYIPQKEEAYYEMDHELFDENHEVYEITPCYSWASSTLPADNLKDYEVDNLTDGRIDTVWAEGADGLGEGEYVYFEFEEPVYITEIELWPGHHESPSLLSENGAPERLILEHYWFSEEVGYESWEDFPLSFDESVKFNRPLVKDNLENFFPTNNLYIYLDACREGSRWEDTCITEIKFYGYYVK